MMSVVPESTASTNNKIRNTRSTSRNLPPPEQPVEVLSTVQPAIQSPRNDSYEDQPRELTPARTVSEAPQETLYAILALLTNRVTASENSGPKGIRVGSPHTFSGIQRSQLRPFLDKLETIF